MATGSVENCQKLGKEKVGGGYKTPIAINFIWNPSDEGEVVPIINAIRKSFARDKDKPFSRGLNIPIFCFSSTNATEPPCNYPEPVACNNLIFAFTSVNSLGRKKWKSYIESFPKSENFRIVPIAIDGEGLCHEGVLSGMNCLRMRDWKIANKDLYAAVFLAHEIYRHGCLSHLDNNIGVDSSITIFLSHAKAGDTGRQHSERIRNFIDNTNMNRFFDANEISPGFQFEKEIEQHINNSTLIALGSDAYSSRYWCQREILSAKKNNRPIVVVNCLEEYEDRIFPAASNVPCIHVSPRTPISDRDVLRILSATIIETIRFNYAIQCLESYRQAGWIEYDCELSARPPEIRQALTLRKSGQTKICYPEPPIYSDESDWHDLLGVEAFTPLWRSSEKDILSTERIGISISDPSENDYSRQHLDSDHLVRLAQDLARHLLARSATLLYGGDLRPNGFTAFILDEARILMDRISDVSPHIENYLAWPLYVCEPELTAWTARYHNVMNTVECEIPDDIKVDVDEGKFLKPVSPHDNYVWSRCLTEMRRTSVSSSTTRICAGGRLFGYKGKMPGVLEEIVIAIASKKPIFLLGGFGGVVGEICDAILNDGFPEVLTEAWQISNNEGYFELQELARSNGHESNYRSIMESIKNVDLEDLSFRCGLDKQEYINLMLSPFSDECLHYVLKGLMKIQE